MRILICGSRDFSDRELLATKLAQFPITEVVEGEARGADTLSRLWAEQRNIPVLKFPANWSKYGKAAGPIRNGQMLTEGKPELVIAFLAADSKGTRNMIAQAQAKGVKVHVVHI